MITTWYNDIYNLPESVEAPGHHKRWLLLVSVLLQIHLISQLMIVGGLEVSVNTPHQASQPLVHGFTLGNL